MMSFTFLCALLLASGTLAFDRNDDGVNAKLVQDSDPCNLQAEPGFCYAYFPNFYYDAQSDKCKPFVYGGCGGNANRFETEKECEKFRYRCLRKRGKPSYIRN